LFRKWMMVKVWRIPPEHGSPARAMSDKKDTASFSGGQNSAEDRDRTRRDD
jgi:hypothetical protein